MKNSERKVFCGGVNEKINTFWENEGEHTEMRNDFFEGVDACD